MSVTPYGKDKLPDRIAAFFMRLAGVKFGRLNCSRLTGFESPDPVYWMQQGYAVVQADVHGKYKSEGHAGVLRQQDAEDYYDPDRVGGIAAVEYRASRTDRRFVSVDVAMVCGCP
jgi:predicted acyl esterase